MDDNNEMIRCRLAAADGHPDKREIFLLESLLLQKDIPYYFNFWEDVRGVSENDINPESIDWESYKFQIQIGGTVSEKLGLQELSVIFSSGGSPRLLEILDMRGVCGFVAEDGKLSKDLTAQQVMEIILQQ